MNKEDEEYEISKILDDFHDKYNKDHAVCPACGSDDLVSTYVGYILDADKIEEYKDENDVVCQNCSWHGIKHDLVSRKE